MPRVAKTLEDARRNPLVGAALDGDRTLLSAAAGLPDIARPGLDILFVGINPSVHSAVAGHHFASKGNPFWRLLHAARLTPTLFRPDEDARLVELGLGIISGCRRPSRAAAELTRAEQKAGAAEACLTIERLRPRMVALLGLTLYPFFFPAGTEPGPGAKRARLGAARVFVLPNPSGLNRSYPGFDSKLVWFQQLRQAAGIGSRAKKNSRKKSRANPLAWLDDGLSTGRHDGSVDHDDFIYRNR